MKALRRTFIGLAALTTLGLPIFAQAADSVTMRLGELTSSLYSYSLTIVGLAVFIMFVIAGLAAMIPGLQKTVGTPTAIIKDAIIGLIILVSAYVVLNTLNPDLVQSGTQ